MEQQKQPIKTSTPVTLEGLTFLVLLVLKLTGKADISWLTVFLPLYIGPALVIIVGLFAAIFMGAKESLKQSREKKTHTKRQDEWIKLMEENKNKKGDNNE